MKHTAEPWFQNALSIYITADGRADYPHLPPDYPIAICHMISPNPCSEDLANAARIVACVNALSGVPDDALRPGSPFYVRVRDMIEHPEEYAP